MNPKVSKSSTGTAGRILIESRHSIRLPTRTAVKYAKLFEF